MFKSLKRNLLVGLALAVGLYFVLGLYADFAALLDSFKGFSWPLLPLALLLVLINYLIRFLKWEYLLRAIDVRVALLPSFVIFISGLTMTLSPGKLGEVLKSFLLKEHSDVAVARSSPVVIAERATDVIGVLILGSAGTLAYGFGRPVLLLTLGLVVTSLLVIQRRSLCLRLLHGLERLRPLKRFIVHLEEFYEATYVLLKGRHLLPTVALSTAGWFLECLAAYLCLRGLGIELPLLLVTFIFVIASLAGALTMIPGGLGVAEGSMAGLLISSGVERSGAVAATLLIRLTTFWFAVALGLLGLLAYSALFSRQKQKPLKVAEGSDA